MLLREITALRAPSGWEDEARNAIRKEAQAALAGREGRVFTDTIGNLYAYRAGTDKRKKHVMIAAHMDEVGFIVRFATEEGLLKFDCVGGIDPRVIVSKRVLVGEKAVPGVIGCKAIHLMTREEREAPPTYEQLSIDVGATTKEEAEKLCPPGSYATFDSEYREFGDGFVKAKALDDRVGCMIALDALRESGYEGDMTCVFTVQEECGFRGAAIAAKRVRPDVAIVLEGTTACDMGAAPAHTHVCCSGKGAVLRFMDKRMVSDWALLIGAQETAKKYGIPVQMRRDIGGGTDAGPIHISGNGVPTLVISAPCRYIHSGASVVKLTDVEATKQLTLAVLKEM